MDTRKDRYARIKEEMEVERDNRKKNKEGRNRIKI